MAAPPAAPRRRPRAAADHARHISRIRLEAFAELLRHQADAAADAELPHGAADGLRHRRAGLDQRGLAEVAGGIAARAQPGNGQDGPDDGLEDRSVRVETTFEGAGIISGDLTPQCAALVTAVLDSLSAPRGAEDSRSYGQRYHDGLHEAMRRLGFCIMIGPVGRPGAPLLRAGAYGPPGRGLLRGGIGPCPAGPREWPGPAGAAGRSRPRSKDTRGPPGRREMATLGQRVNFAGVSSDRRVKAQTAAW